MGFAGEVTLEIGRGCSAGEAAAERPWQGGRGVAFPWLCASERPCYSTPVSCTRSIAQVLVG